VRKLGALVRESGQTGRCPLPSAQATITTAFGRPSSVIQFSTLQAIDGFGFLGLPVPGTKPVHGDRLVAEEGVLDGALAMVARLLLSLSSPQLFF
jgi:hypothetical protein